MEHFSGVRTGFLVCTMKPVQAGMPNAAYLRRQTGAKRLLTFLLFRLCDLAPCREQKKPLTQRRQGAKDAETTRTAGHYRSTC